MSRILIIGEGQEVFELVRYILIREGFQVAPILKAASKLQQIKSIVPDLLIFDSIVPRLSRTDIWKEIRTDKSLANVPILVLLRVNQTARAFGSAAKIDAYLKRPLDPRQLVARVDSLIRRRADFGEPESPIRLDALVIDPAAYRVERAGKIVPLSVLEFRLLHFLASRPNTVCRRDQLLNEVWRDSHTTPRTVDVCIRHLREKIEDDPNEPVYIRSVRAVGYTFQMAVPGRKMGS